MSEPKQQLLFEIKDFSAGLNTYDSPDNLEAGESPDMLNVDITQKGAVVTRTGYELASDLGGTGGLRGLLPYYCTYGSNIGDYLLVFHNDGGLYYVQNPVDAPTGVGSYGTDSGKVRGTVFNNLAIFGNGLAANSVKKFDGSSIANLGGSPMDAKYFSTFQKRLWMAGDSTVPNRLDYTATDNPEASGGSINVNIGDGEDLTGMVAHNDFLQVYKEDSIYGVNFSFDSSYVLTVPQLQPIVNRAGGCISPDTIQVIYNDTYFLSKRGFQIYGVQPQGNGVRRAQSISDKIENLVRTFDVSQYANMCSTYYDSRYIVAIPSGQSNLNDYCLVYNTRYGSWTMYSDIPAVSFAKFRDENKRDQVYFASSAEPRLYRFNSTFSDGDFGYLRRWKSKTFRYGSRTWWDHLYIRGAAANGTTLTVRIEVDGVPYETTITEDNFIQGYGGGFIGDSYVGSNPIGGEGGAVVNMFRFEKVVTFPELIKVGSEMNFQFSNDGPGEGWKIDSVACYGHPEPQEPYSPRAYN